MDTKSPLYTLLMLLLLLGLLRLLVILGSSWAEVFAEFCTFDLQMACWWIMTGKVGLDGYLVYGSWSSFRRHGFRFMHYVQNIRPRSGRQTASKNGLHRPVLYVLWVLSTVFTAAPETNNYVKLQQQETCRAYIVDDELMMKYMYNTSRNSTS